MVVLREEDRRDLEELRERLIRRIDDLEDQESYGTITEETRRATLNKEFGSDYEDTLRFINDVLHRTNREHRIIPHTREAAIITYCVLAITIIAALVWPGITGGVTDTNTQVINITLAPNTPTLLPINHPLIIHDIATDRPAHITITDDTGTYELLNHNECEACDQPLRPPYILRATTAVIINTISYTATP